MTRAIDSHARDVTAHIVHLCSHMSVNYLKLILDAAEQSALYSRQSCDNIVAHNIAQILTSLPQGTIVKVMCDVRKLLLCPPVRSKHITLYSIKAGRPKSAGAEKWNAWVRAKTAGGAA